MKLAIWPYPHFKRKPKPIVPASKEDVARLFKETVLAIRIGRLSVRSRRRLAKQLQKEGKL